MQMNSIHERYPVHNQECICRLESGLYRVYWYDSEMRAFLSNGALVWNVTHWIPVSDLVKAVFSHPS